MVVRFTTVIRVKGTNNAIDHEVKYVGHTIKLTVVKVTPAARGPFLLMRKQELFLISCHWSSADIYQGRANKFIIQKTRVIIGLVSFGGL